jgi:uncharacterized membrane protein YeaQ/YmgE (transglycosylase-associated protein family)
VFPVSPAATIVNLLGYAIFGMAIGALSGWLTSLITKCGPQGVWKDAFLGLFGYFAGLFGSLLMPWPQNTISEHLEGGGTVTSTMNSYQHPERVAIVMAVLLPLLHELYRFKRGRMN